MGIGSLLSSTRGKGVAVVGVVVLILAVGAGATLIGGDPGRQPDAGAANGNSTTPENGTYQTVVIFRNDDIQPWWRSEERRAVDQVFIDEGVPVSLGIVPIIAGEPITAQDNRELCAYLSGLNANHPDVFEMALHGYTHEQRTDFQGASEFGGSSLQDQTRWVEHGSSVIEECTGQTPVSFIPPFDTYDNTTVEAIASAGYVAVSGGEDQAAEYYGEREPFVTNGVTHVPNDGDLVADWSTHEFHTPAEMRGRFDSAYENGTVYVQMLHYFTFTEDRRVEQLRSFIQYMKGHDGVLFMTIEQFARAYQSERLVRTDDGWVYHTDASSVQQPGLSCTTGPCPTASDGGV